MPHKMLLLSYWFPPNNVIGASRAAAIYRFFRVRRWEVTVICANSSAASRDFETDITDIDVHRVSDSPITEFLNFKAERKRWVRLVSGMLRYGAFPDAFRSTILKMEQIAGDLIANGRGFDVVMSTAPPFSQHEIARNLAHKASALLVLDNRDTWACSNYRRRMPFSDQYERRYEFRVLSAADMVTTVSDGMSQYYKNQYPDLAGLVSTIRNGVDNNSMAGNDLPIEKQHPLRIVYTGILYGGKRDVRPVFEAAKQTGLHIAFDFYGSESDWVNLFKRNYPELEIIDHGRVSRNKALDAQQTAGALLVVLDNDDSERMLLPGKFFEYVGTGRPIIVVADSDYEIGRLVEKHDLGLCSRSTKLIAQFFYDLKFGKIALRQKVPTELTRENQLMKLESQIITKLGETKRMFAEKIECDNR